MTAQIGDQYKYSNGEYTFVAQSAPIPFHPSEFGIIPMAACTACWSGFWCVYNITEDGIFLEDLYVNSGNEQYPAINGILPECQDGNETFTYMGHHRYAGLNIKIPYTGKILVGGDFVHGYYRHMGHQRPWAYKKLLELVFENGKLIQTTDQSKIASSIRKKIRSDEGFTEKMFKHRFGFIVGDSLLDDGNDVWWL